MTIVKNNEYRGTLDLIGSSYEVIDENSHLYQKLKRIKVQFSSFKPPKEILKASIFLLKPLDMKKKYYFIVDNDDIDKWIHIISMAINGKDHLIKEMKRHESLPTLILHDDSFINSINNNHNKEHISKLNDEIDYYDISISARKGSNYSNISSGSTYSFRSSISSINGPSTEINDNMNYDDPLNVNN